MSTLLNQNHKTVVEKKKQTKKYNDLYDAGQVQQSLLQSN